MDRHLRARDDPINARMNDPRRWQGQSFTATPTGATRNYFPKVIGGSGASHSTISEQDILLTKVGGSLNG